MYEHPIYKSAVLMKNQKECNQAKKLCIKYELPIWEEKNAFDIAKGHKNYLFFYQNLYDNGYHFYVDILADYELTPLNIISLEEFEALCEELSPQAEQDINDIISTIKELNNLLNNKQHENNNEP